MPVKAGWARKVQCSVAWDMLSLVWARLQGSELNIPEGTGAASGPHGTNCARITCWFCNVKVSHLEAGLWRPTSVAASLLGGRYLSDVDMSSKNE